jgi:quercetin dioxygenase-like cupin family protein
MQQNKCLKAGFMSLLSWAALSGAAEQSTSPQAEAVEVLMQRELIGVPDKELLMVTVEYLPGGASLPHRHDAQVFVYVLQGALTMQVKGAPPVTIRQGESFYESPADVHLVSANASKTASAKILVFIVKPKGAPVSRPATARSEP